MAKVKNVNKVKYNFDFRFNSIAGRTAVVLALLGVLYWMLKPVIEMPPQRDSGCFLYIGQNWLKGMVPYRDMWDHKGPLLYLLNAIGILINGFKGVLFLQILMTGAGLYFLFYTLQKFVNSVAALIIAFTGVFFLFFIHQSGNQTEQWAIGFQGITLFLYLGGKKETTVDKKKWLCIGIFMACSFLLRPNQIALWMVIAVFEVYNLVRRQQNGALFIRKFLLGLSGFLLPVTLFSLYFFSHNALDDMLDCLFRFNFIYTENANSDLINSVIAGFANIPSLWLVLVVTAVSPLLLFKNKGNYQYYVFGLMWWIFEILFSTMAGPGHLHYYIQWVLPVLFLFGISLYHLKQLNLSFQNLIYVQIFVSLIMSVSVFIKLKAAYAKQMSEVKTYQNEFRFREKVVDKVLEHTDEGDYVLEWGLVDGINFMSERPSPSRYFYPYALDTKGYTSSSRISEFLNDIKKNRPRLIIDASKMERFPQIDSINRDSFYRAKPHLKGLLPANINEFYSYVESNYNYIGNVGFMLLFKRKENNN